MRKLIAVLFIVGVTLSSCEKDETVAAKDYTTHTVVLNLNSEDGVLPDGYVSPSDGRPPMDPYYYSVQYSFSFSDKEIENKGVVNNSADYQFIVVPKAPDSELVENLPADGDWQLMVANYTTDAFFQSGGIWMSMPLVGVLINKNIEVANVKDENFDTITLDDAGNFEYKNDVDAIGHDWQYYSRAEHKYVIDTDNYYLVKVKADEIYKLKFVDFYGDGKEKGEKGHLTLQFELLK